MGIPLSEATAVALLLNVVSLLFATINYWRGKLIDWRVGVPILITAVLLAPLGARVTPLVNKQLLLGLFAAFLIFAGAMMLFYKAKPRPQPFGRSTEAAIGAGLGSVAGFLGGLLGVGGGNFILPVLNWLGSGRQSRCRHYGPGRRLRFALWLPRPCHVGRPGSNLSDRDRRRRCQWLDCWFTVDEESPLQRPTQAYDRHSPLGDCRQNGF